jgi:hypothetical protein
MLRRQARYSALAWATFVTVNRLSAHAFASRFGAQYGCPRTPTAFVFVGKPAMARDASAWDNVSL